MLLESTWNSRCCTLTCTWCKHPKFPTTSRAQLVLRKRETTFVTWHGLWQNLQCMWGSLGTSPFWCLYYTTLQFSKCIIFYLCCRTPTPIYPCNIYAITTHVRLYSTEQNNSIVQLPIKLSLKKNIILKTKGHFSQKATKKVCINPLVSHLTHTWIILSCSSKTWRSPFLLDLYPITQSLKIPFHWTHYFNIPQNSP